MTRHFLIILTILALTNCNSDKKVSKPIPADKIDYIIFGRYCGMAVRPPYSKMYKIVDNRLLIDITDSFYENQGNVTFNGDTATKEQFDKTQTLRQNVYEFFLTTKDSVFGNPDDHDQCGLYLEFKTQNQVRRFNIDTEVGEDNPKEIKYTAGLLGSLINDIEK
jgi:hypothetical protein